MKQHPLELLKLAKSLEDYLDSESTVLTMGGEPTFIPAQPDAAEWNTAAMGEEKLGYARRMAGQLIDSVYTGALAMQVFGKWYPGEPLPRWNIVTLHHRGGEALWPETERLLLDDVDGRNEIEVGETLMRRVAEELSLSKFVFPAVEQSANKTDTASGWVLPLEYASKTWSSAKWPFSTKKPVTLFIGDSPVGLRMPLNDLDEDTMRTALTVEVRSGALEIFIPPLNWEGFQVLVALLRSIIVAMDLKDVLLCGYAPSKAGNALLNVGLAADPGVLEVNLPPARNWLEYDQFLTECAGAAEEEGLQLTKFQLNGGVYGTGGGSHLAFGGESIETNPFLAEPKRIASFLRYWQRHPALSYLFTGQHVGPGSQAPRVDEGPRHGLYELEVACEGLESLGSKADGETIDQFLRNLLTDSSGNTHRAEICFDKFFNFAAPNGKLGIVELRAFETFADAATMSRVALFIRCIFVRLFKAPYKEPLHRFGPELHDRYFLPAFLWEDMQLICKDLKAHGIDFDSAWMEPVLEFRSPSVGTLKLPEGSLNVRQAFESFPLMAEESRGTDTIRVVDNSSDRLQLTLSNPALIEKGKLYVNEVEVPFKLVDGKMICGLRYKSASAYPALHPHVPIQSPLWFEWVDGESGETMAASKYHFWNPDGPVYDGRPKNGEEAKARREARWQKADDLIGRKLNPIIPKLSPEFEYTLDLRRQLRV